MHESKRQRQIHWNTLWEELKAKAKIAIEDDEKSAIYARRKVEVKSVFGHIKGNLSFRRFSLWGLQKVHVEFGLAALAHNLLKVAGIRLASFLRRQALTGLASRVHNIPSLWHFEPPTCEKESANLLGCAGLLLS
ncbi:transposase [Paenibacillaceae sp. P-4]